MVRDTLPANVSYVTNSTTSNGVAVADSGTTPFPLDESGLTVTSLAASSSTLLTFRVTVISGTSISNSVTVTNLNGLVQAYDVASVTPPPPSCNLSFTDGSGNPVSVCAENAGLYVTMTDSSQNTNPTNAPDGHCHNNQPFQRGRGIAHADRDGNQHRGFPQYHRAAHLHCPGSGPAGRHSEWPGGPGDLASSFTGAGGETCSASATFVPAVQTKKLYLSEPGTEPGPSGPGGRGRHDHHQHANSGRAGGSHQRYDRRGRGVFRANQRQHADLCPHDRHRDQSPDARRGGNCSPECQLGHLQWNPALLRRRGGTIAARQTAR